jgi:IS1 family transposase
MDKALFALNCLIEGCSIRSTERLTGLHRDTIMDLLVKTGRRCADLLESKIKSVQVRDVQADEVWSFCYKKEGHKRQSEVNNEAIGDAYVFIGIERNTKMILAWHLGKRTGIDTDLFISKLAKATAEKPFQISTDGWAPYSAAIEKHLVPRGVDFSQVVKSYGKVEDGREARYSPSEVTNITKTPMLGLPDMSRSCTSHIERQNGTLRQWCKRFTRLTYAFSKKWPNMSAALALHFAHYNFCRVHGALKVTPAMEAGITNRVWSLAELIQAGA